MSCEPDNPRTEYLFKYAERISESLSFALPGVVKQLGSNHDATQDSYQVTNKIRIGEEQHYAAV
jgi:hypothetical protein